MVASATRHAAYFLFPTIFIFFKKLVGWQKLIWNEAFSNLKFFKGLL